MRLMENDQGGEGATRRCNTAARAKAVPPK